MSLDSLLAGTHSRFAVAAVQIVEGTGEPVCVYLFLRIDERELALVRDAFNKENSEKIVCGQAE